MHKSALTAVRCFILLPCSAVRCFFCLARRFSLCFAFSGGFGGSFYAVFGSIALVVAFVSHRRILHRYLDRLIR